MGMHVAGFTSEQSSSPAWNRLRVDADMPGPHFSLSERQQQGYGLRAGMIILSVPFPLLL